jgi:thiol-disulfide isomerase/thioredoxin
MTPLEVVAFAALWLIACVLGGLVLLLYRQIERAYQLQAGQAGGLLPGVEAPGLEIIGTEGTEPLLIPVDDSRMTVLAFMSTVCEACEKLMPALENDALVNASVIALMSGETTKWTVPSENPRVQMHWLAHPPDAVKRYGASVTPFLYVLRGRVILASKAVSTRAALKRLLDEANANEEQLRETPTAVVELAGVT